MSVHGGKFRQLTSVTCRGFAIKVSYAEKLLLLNIALTKSAGFLEMNLEKLSRFRSIHVSLIQLQLGSWIDWTQLIFSLQRAYNDARGYEDCSSFQEAGNLLPKISSSLYVYLASVSASWQFPGRFRDL
jgi:hypothetical protein